MSVTKFPLFSRDTSQVELEPVLLQYELILTNYIHNDFIDQKVTSEVLGD